MRVKYFENIEKAEIFIKNNNIKKYHYETPEMLENGVDLIVEDGFFCEICGGYTPFECEGSEPNTCAMCMPLPDNEFMGQN